jgi:hypothetical protein
MRIYRNKRWYETPFYKIKRDIIKISSFSPSYKSFTKDIIMLNSLLITLGHMYDRKCRNEG